MTREEIYSSCLQELSKTNFLLLEAATGTGKSSLSIRLANYLMRSKWFEEGYSPLILILVAKRVHKQTWAEEIEKWGGFKAKGSTPRVEIQCYESLHKCQKHWDIIIADEVHHLGSDNRLELFEGVGYSYFLGLSATIPRKLKQEFKYKYHSLVVSCNLQKAIEDDILPEPQILLYPLVLDNRAITEEWELNAKKGGRPEIGEYKDLWKFKSKGAHAIIRCTQKQKCIEYDKLISFFKRNNKEQAKLFFAGKRLEYLSDIKLPIVKNILRYLGRQRSITFCKTIPQAEEVSKNCIHSKNAESEQVYKDFNKKKINQISAVNILNENANLVDCKYAIFCNLSSSEISVPQRIGRSLRHKSPVIIVPYYQGTREEELAKNMVEGFNQDCVKVIHSIQEI